MNLTGNIGQVEWKAFRRAGVDGDAVFDWIPLAGPPDGPWELIFMPAARKKTMDTSEIMPSDPRDLFMPKVPRKAPRKEPVCDCGALKAKTPHARWCSTKENDGPL